MKAIKVSITIPEPLFRFAEKKAVQRAKEREERPNISGIFKELLLEQRDRETQKKAA